MMHAAGLCIAWACNEHCIFTNFDMSDYWVVCENMETRPLRAINSPKPLTPPFLYHRSELFVVDLPL